MAAKVEFKYILNFFDKDEKTITKTLTFVTGELSDSIFTYPEGFDHHFICDNKMYYIRAKFTDFTNKEITVNFGLDYRV